jgi:hypothetical protein
VFHTRSAALTKWAPLFVLPFQSVSSFSTLATDSGLFTHDPLELALDHVHDSAVARTYDRGERREERIKLACRWDAMLNPPPGDVIPISPRTAAAV